MTSRILVIGVVLLAVGFGVFAGIFIGRGVETWYLAQEVRADLDVLKLKMEDLRESIESVRAQLVQAQDQLLDFEIQVIEGVASWYGPGFDGRRTANGEIYDMRAMTVAHRTLPLGTMVVVTNLETGESVLARVNDRGPYVKGRNIDVSRGVAERLGMLEDGLKAVSVAAIIPKVVRR